MECVYKKTGILFKLLPCLLILMIAFMTLYGSFVYATDDYTFVNDGDNCSFVVDGSEYPISSALLTQDYYVIFTYEDSGNIFYSYICCTEPFYVTNYNSSSTQFRTFNDVSANWSYYFTTSNALVNFHNRTTSNISNTEGVSACRFGRFNNSYLASSFTLYDESDNVVFPIPTQEVGEQAIVATQIQPVEMNKTQQEIIAILPVILLVIVGLIAIRKAIQFLMRIMRKA